MSYTKTYKKETGKWDRYIDSLVRKFMTTYSVNDTSKVNRDKLMRLMNDTNFTQKSFDYLYKVSNQIERKTKEEYKRIVQEKPHDISKKLTASHQAKVATQIMDRVVKAQKDNLKKVDVPDTYSFDEYDDAMMVVGRTGKKEKSSLLKKVYKVYSKVKIFTIPLAVLSIYSKDDIKKIQSVFKKASPNDIEVVGDKVKMNRNAVKSLSKANRDSVQVSKTEHKKMLSPINKSKRLITKNIEHDAGAQLTKTGKDRTKKVVAYETRSEYQKQKLDTLKGNGVTYVDIELSSDHSITDICFSEDTLIQMNNGVKYISDVQIGDIVRTTLGNYKSVTRTMNNGIKPINRYYFRGQNIQDFHVDATQNHPVLTDRGWVAIGDLNEEYHCIFSPLKHNEFCDQYVCDVSHTNIQDYLNGVHLNNFQNIFLELCDVIGDSRESHKYHIQQINSILQKYEVLQNADNILREVYHLANLDCLHPFEIQTIFFLLLVCVETIQFDLYHTLGYFSHESHTIENNISDLYYSAYNLSHTLDKSLFYPNGSYSYLDNNNHDYNKLNMVDFVWTEILAYILSHNIYNNTYKHPFIEFITSYIYNIMNFNEQVLVNYYKYDNIGDDVVYNLTIEDDNTYIANGLYVHNCDDLKGTYPIDSIPLGGPPFHPYCKCGIHIHK